MKTTTSKTKEDDDDNTSITKQANNKGEKAKAGWAFCNLFFLGFVLWWVLFFSFYVSFKPRKFFFITENLVITYKLSTIEGFYYKVNDFATILGFLGFCHNL